MKLAMRAVRVGAMLLAVVAGLGCGPDGGGPDVDGGAAIDGLGPDEPGAVVDAAGPPAYHPPSSRRQVIDLNPTWRFVKADLPGAHAAGFDDRAWADVCLPHTWNAADGQDGHNDYHRGAGWYRRHLFVPSALAGHRLYLQFDGANIVTDVWVNGLHVGQHRGGFARFRFDVSHLLQVGADNLIAVKVDNRPVSDVPPLSGDFTFSGGLYRAVQLLATDPVHIDVEDFGSSGVYLTTRQVSAASAQLEARVRLANDDVSPRIVAVESIVVGADGSVVTRLRGEQTLAPGQRAELRLAGTVDQPHLWDGRADPYLHTVHTVVRDQGVVLDRVDQPLGFRSFAVTPQEGFTLNGHPLELRGVLRHQDRQDQGWAVTDDQHAQDVALIAEMGANAVRLVHYQQAQQVHDLCDRTGLVVWSELGLVDSIVPSAPFAQNARQQLTELIRQNHNHPSIAFWGLGNELVDFPNGFPIAAAPFVAALKDLAHAEDPSRPTTLATHLPEAFALNWQADLVGFNQYFGWYYGTTADLGPWVDKVHQAHPDRSVALSEFGAGASIGLHSLHPKAGDHTEEYQALYHEASWKALAARPFVWGKYITFMFDLASDGRNEGDTPGRNDKGLVTYDRRTKKDAFFWYKANWSSEPFVHITGRRFDPRPSASNDIKVYSNLDRVALVVNGRDLGTKTSDDHVFVWPAVDLQPGSNRVQAVAVKGDVLQTDAVTWTVVEPGDAGPPEDPPVMRSGPCTALVNDGPLVAVPSPMGPPPAMTGGPLIDGTYVLTSALNLSFGSAGVRVKMRISGGGTRTELVQRTEGMPETNGAGTIVTEGNLMFRTFSCPGPATQILQYTATATTIQTLSSTGQVATLVRQP